MKTVEERSLEFCRIIMPIDPDHRAREDDEQMQRSMCDEIILLLKEQDKITRHACAANVNALDCDYLENAEHAINQAHHVIMNTKAV